MDLPRVWYQLSRAGFGPAELPKLPRNVAGVAQAVVDHNPNLGVGPGQLKVRRGVFVGEGEDEHIEPEGRALGPRTSLEANNEELVFFVEVPEAQPQVADMSALVAEFAHVVRLASLRSLVCRFHNCRYVRGFRLQLWHIFAAFGARVGDGAAFAYIDSTLEMRVIVEEDTWVRLHAQLVAAAQAADIVAEFGQLEAATVRGTQLPEFTPSGDTPTDTSAPSSEVGKSDLAKKIAQFQSIGQPPPRGQSQVCHLVDSSRARELTALGATPTARQKNANNVVLMPAEMHIYFDDEQNGGQSEQMAIEFVGVDDVQPVQDRTQVVLRLLFRDAEVAAYVANNFFPGQKHQHGWEVRVQVEDPDLFRRCVQEKLRQTYEAWGVPESERPPPQF